jgi:hypothetical protein
MQEREAQKKIIQKITTPTVKCSMKKDAINMKSKEKKEVSK